MLEPTTLGSATASCDRNTLVGNDFSGTSTPYWTAARTNDIRSANRT